MLEKIKQKKTKKDEAAEALSQMQEELINIANEAKAKKLPVIITMVGCGKRLTDSKAHKVP